VNTQSHAILTTVLVRLGLQEKVATVKYLNPLLVAGALTPDLPLFVFFFWFSFFDPHSQVAIWNECYYYPGWQIAINAFHSFTIWGFLALLLWWLRKLPAALFSLAALLASAEDFLLHSDDAHAHFWPLTDYRFNSPVSYWDPEFHGAIASLGEIMVVLLAALWLWPRVATTWGKLLLLAGVVTLMGSHGIWSLIFTVFH